MILRGRSSRAATLAAIVALTAASAPAAASAGAVEVAASPAVGEGTAYQPGEAIVRFEPGTTATERSEARRAADVVFDSALGIPRAQVVEVDGSVEAAIWRLESQPGVAYAQPNYRYEALTAPIPNDPFFEDLWGLMDPAFPSPGVSVLEAWDTTRGGGEVIAVVDTGVDLTHPDLAGNLWTNTAEDEGGDGDDDDSNGSIDDVHGYDFVDDDGDPDDYDFHGTHVAGTAAAIAGNGLGIAGVAPEARIMAVRALDGDGRGTSADIAEGIAYAARNGAGVINLSLGGPVGIDQDGFMSTAIDFAAGRNTVVVAAAGNDHRDNDASPVLPCALPQDNLICVAALRQSGGFASFSNWGATSVDLAAPGTNILSAQTDYRTLFTEGFEGGTTGWDPSTDAGIPWGRSTLFSVGAFSVADSPDAGQRYAPNSDTQLIKSDPVSLVGERGCRMHFDLLRDIQPTAPNGAFFDRFFAGAIAPGPEQEGIWFAGSSNGVFRAEEASIAGLDGGSGVRPSFALFSNATQEFDGVNVDNLRLLCRDQTYSPDTVNYVAFQGTSMAAPHVSGIAALVRAAAPGATATEVVDAILAGASSMPSPDPLRPTVTGGIADACQAIAVATGNATPLCPGSSRPPSPSPPPLSPGTTSSTFSDSPTGKSSAPRDRTRPQTSITLGPGKVSFTRGGWKRVVFRFRSSEAGSAFLCKVDQKPFHQCHRRLIRWFSVGEHVLRVKARDAAGNVDRTPAVYRFQVKRAG